MYTCILMYVASMEVSNRPKIFGSRDDTHYSTYNDVAYGQSCINGHRPIVRLELEIIYLFVDQDQTKYGQTVYFTRAYARGSDIRKSISVETSIVEIYQLINFNK